MQSYSRFTVVSLTLMLHICHPAACARQLFITRFHLGGYLNRSLHNKREVFREYDLILFERGCTRHQSDPNGSKFGDLKAIRGVKPPTDVWRCRSDFHLEQEISHHPSGSLLGHHC